MIAFTTDVSAATTASVWIASLFLAALGAIALSWFSSSIAKSSTLRRPTSFLSMASATGRGAPPPAPPTPPLPPVPGVPGTKLENRLLYWIERAEDRHQRKLPRWRPLSVAHVLDAGGVREASCVEISPKSVRLSAIEFA